MSVLTIGILAALAVFILLLWLLRSQGRGAKVESPLDRNVERLLPVHYRYFPQVIQALSASDEQYLRERAPGKVAQRAIEERRAVARQFLSGLLEDFSNLERLARLIAALSPAVSREQETERLILGLKFRVIYALAWLRFSTGRVPVRRIEDLTNLVGQLAKLMQEGMVAIGALSDDTLTSSRLNA